MITGSGASCSVVVEIQQSQATPRDVRGSIKPGCAVASRFYARLVERIPWDIAGQASFVTTSFTYPYVSYTYRASLTGTVEGSPPSRISAAVSPFTNPERGTGADRSWLHLTKGGVTVPH
jgi:hypothetical protein